MKALIVNFLAAALLMPMAAFGADKNSQTFEIKDPAWGMITLALLTDGEPVYQPVKMTVKLLCNDQRKAKTSVKPKEETLIDGEAICEFKEQSFDEKNKILSIRFTTAEAEAGEARCNSEWTQSFDFKDLCSEWRNY